VLSLFWELSALQQMSSRLNAELRKELEVYRVIMLDPRLMPPKAPAIPEKQSAAAANKPKPLAVPDPRILRALDPALGGFINENPGVESVITREIVRDVDSGALNVRALLQKSGMRIRFGLDESGHIRWRRIEESSGVPSIDHLALELVRLLEKYGLLEAIQGVEQVNASIMIDRQIDIVLEGRAGPEAQIEGIRGRLEAGLMLWRLLVPADEAASYLQDVSIVAQGNRIRISKSYDKDSIIKLLTQYYHPGPAK